MRTFFIIKDFPHDEEIANPTAHDKLMKAIRDSDIHNVRTNIEELETQQPKLKTRDITQATS